jgi:hypothetical protein
LTKLISLSLTSAEDFIVNKYPEQNTILVNGRLNEMKVLLDALENKKKETGLRHVELGTEDSIRTSVSLDEAQNRIRHAADEFDELLERVRNRISIPDLNGIPG